MGAALQHKPLWDISAMDVTNDRTVRTCRADADVATALQMMQSHKVRRLPVVNANGDLVGIVSIDDIVALAQKGGPELSFDDAMTTLKAVCVHH
jgi:CBS domain-containing protein